MHKDLLKNSLEMNYLFNGVKFDKMNDDSGRHGGDSDSVIEAKKRQKRRNNSLE